MEKKHTPTTFHEWVKQTFTWVDNDVKRYMQRSWAASTKAANKRNKQETEHLQSENERMRELLKEIELDYSNEANEYHMMNLSEQSKFWSDKADEINNILNPK